MEVLNQHCGYLQLPGQFLEPDATLFTGGINGQQGTRINLRGRVEIVDLANEFLHGRRSSEFIEDQGLFLAGHFPFVDLPENSLGLSGIDMTISHRCRYHASNEQHGLGIRR